jgi:hypothetical protein
MDVAACKQLAADWRAESVNLKRRGAHCQAEVMLSCAEDLEQRAQQWTLETLTLEEAAEESGYSYSALQQKISKGEMRNAGTKYRPRVYRCDVPKKSTRQSLSSGTEPDLVGQILAVA